MFLLPIPYRCSGILCRLGKRNRIRVHGSYQASFRLKTSVIYSACKQPAASRSKPWLALTYPGSSSVMLAPRLPAECSPTVSGVSATFMWRVRARLFHLKPCTVFDTGVPGSVFGYLGDSWCLPLPCHLALSQAGVPACCSWRDFCGKDLCCTFQEGMVLWYPGHCLQ